MAERLKPRRELAMSDCHLALRQILSDRSHLEGRPGTLPATFVERAKASQARTDFNETNHAELCERRIGLGRCGNKEGNRSRSGKCDRTY